MSNPLLAFFDTPFGLPPFAEVQDSHIAEAFEHAMAEHNREIDALVSNPEPASFANTIEALERCGELLVQTSLILFNLCSADTNPERQKLEQEFSPRLAAHHDAINMNPALFARIQSVWQQREQLTLTAEQARILSETYKRFVRSGALLAGERKSRLEAINQELAKLQVRFSQSVLAETTGFELVVENAADLAGLPQSAFDAASSKAEAKGYTGKWLFTVQHASLLPFLTYAKNRELRRQMYLAYTQRGDQNNKHDNNAMVAKIASLRVEKANLLGFDTMAHYELDNRMAQTPARVTELLDQLWAPAVNRANQEAAAMQALMDSEGQGETLEAWDWWYYAEQIRQREYNVDEDAIKPYFSLDAVLGGAFACVEKLYGVSFNERTDLEGYHPDVRAFEVSDSSGENLGLFLADYYVRDSKRAGAWMSVYRVQSNLSGRAERRPVVVNVCNFAPPQGDKPSLLSFDEVRTLFHELGHALHGLFSRCTYPSLAGTSVVRDFVELPSQIFEHWAVEPEIMQQYARHFETGEPISDELIAKLKRVGKFNQGFGNTEYLAACYLDLAWHSLATTTEQDPREFEAREMQRIGLPAVIAPRYRSTYFSHVFSGGYVAGYYSYIWAAVLDCDGFAAFKQSGNVFNSELAGNFRKYILEAGNSAEAMGLYTQFRGREPQIQALLESRGLN